MRGSKEKIEIWKYSENPISSLIHQITFYSLLLNLASNNLKNEQIGVKICKFRDKSG